MAVYIWGFSAKFAVYEPAPGLPSELLDRSHPRPPCTAWLAPMLVETYEVRGKRAPPGDFPGTTGFSHLLSPRAVDAMGDVFTRDGTIFPVEVEGQGDGWHLFHPTTVVDCLDIDASKVTRLPFRPAEITAVINPVFRAGIVPSQGLFVVPECRHGDIYVCEDVKTLAKKHKLKGLVLSADFFGKPWIS